MKKYVALALCIITALACPACKKDSDAGAASPTIPDFFHHGDEPSPQPSGDPQAPVPTDPVTPGTPMTPLDPAPPEGDTPVVSPDPVTPPAPADPVTPADPQPPVTPVEPTPVTPPEAEPPAGSVTVTYPVNAVNGGVTYTGLPSLPEVEFAVPDADNSRGLSCEKIDFAYGAAKNGAPHHITENNQKTFDSYGTGALAWDNKTTDKRVLYLTFDCGYEYKNITPQMIDILKEKQVPAAFFCTLSYIKDAPEVVKYMIEEGHIVGNHSVHHPSDSAVLPREELAAELLGVHNYLRVNFGYECRYFRFPTGAFSENAIDLCDSVGYRSVFWSVAHADWDPENQPGVDKSFKTVTSRLHPGAVILLHTTAPDNLAILADFIDYARAEGYEFCSLDDYQYWN
ncbi:MAG: polysaccharide deacetylase family protein [Clostridia bacterium]|nr:polysaccharide deacetylase family protein [Clostridia bacterium]